jgi:hypothetical protein
MAKSWITDVVRALKPVLLKYGFVATGRTFHRVSGAGDVAVVEIQKSTDRRGDRERFYVNVGVVPGPWWDWLCVGVAGTGTRDAGRPYATAGIWHQRIDPPPEQPASAPGIPFSAVTTNGALVQRVLPEVAWVVNDAASAAWVAERLTEEFEGGVLAHLVALLGSRDALLSEAGGAPLDSLRIAFLAEAGGGDEMEARLQERLDSHAENPDERPATPNFVAWARDYAARRRAVTGQEP